MKNNKMSYEEAREYISNACKFGMNFGLDRTVKILELLGNPHKKVKFIHVGGTNGKGSTSSIINSILIEAGFKVGMYTSPYLEEFEERIQINRQNISKESLALVISEVKDVIDKVREYDLGEPTEFEIITCAMFLYFYKENIDIGIIEVGLGGRLDSTNVITPILSILTSISYDHMNILGNTLQEIAKEKAGILKNGVPLILYPQSNEVYEVIKEKAIEKSVEIVNVSADESHFVKIYDDGKNINQVFKWRNVNYTLPLLGEHQILNATVALNAIKILREKYNFDIKDEQILSGVKKTTWIGRMEIMKRNPTVVIDGAHNEDGIIKLKNNIKKYFNYSNLYLIIGILSDKEVDKMTSIITPMAKEVVAVTPHSDRAEIAIELKKNIEKFNKNVSDFQEYEDAYKYIVNKSDKNDLIVITGSLYMIGDMRKIIKKLEW